MQERVLGASLFHFGAGFESLWSTSTLLFRLAKLLDSLRCAKFFRVSYHVPVAKEILSGVSQDIVKEITQKLNTRSEDESLNLSFYCRFFSLECICLIVLQVFQVWRKAVKCLAIVKLKNQWSLNLLHSLLRLIS